MSDPTVYPATHASAALVLAHGAGAGQSHPFMVRVARALAARRVVVMTFDFPYITARRRVPDKAPVLEEAWRQAIANARGRAESAGLPVFIGGKSMGGRIASHVAAQGVEGVAGLVFLGYPLHPPGRPQQRRDAHLPSIAVPTLFVQGERDEFGSADEIRDLLPRLRARAELHVVPGGDHSFSFRPKNAASASVLDDVAAVVAGWIGSILSVHQPPEP